LETGSPALGDRVACDDPCCPDPIISQQFTDNLRRAQTTAQISRRIDTGKGHDAIAGRGADAVIATRKNAKPCKPDTVGARARNDILRATNPNAYSCNSAL
jgi:hypothetical protein